MFLPDSAQLCLSALRQAGFRGYAVGGCVRDSLLGLTPHDYDLCTNASPAEICRVFHNYRLILNGEKHGTVGVVVDGEVLEITTFRTEGSYTDSRHPDWVRFVGSVEEDLARRDFTVNAMAYSPEEGYIDPWGGQQDLKNHILRAVGDPATRFREDALRILRGVRFAVRFGLTPEAETEKAMNELAPLMDHLARERVFEELCKLLPLINAQQLQRYNTVLTQVIPELAPSVGFDQRSPHHAYDVFTHISHVVETIPPTPVLRWAALLHDVGKPQAFTTDETGRGHFLDHAKIGGAMADNILRRLKAPTALREQVVFLVAHHMTPLQPDKPLLRRRLGKYGEQTVRELLALQRADFCSKGTKSSTDDAFFSQVENLLEQILVEEACLTLHDLAVNGQDLMALGFTPGPHMGHCLNDLLLQVQNETLPNEKDILLQAAQGYLQPIPGR